MGLFQKIKDFGSRVISGIKNGWQKIKPYVKPFIEPAKQLVRNLVPGGSAIIDTGEKIYDVIKGGGGGR